MKILLLCLVLQFDGSLRKPRDAGFPNTNGLGQIASGGAAVLSSDDNRLLALGGKPIAVSSTSTHAEYDGLLMGLQWLVHQSDEWWDKFMLETKSDRVLTIQGDCRTVIDQLNGLAVPRKLRPQHDEAATLLENLSSRFDLVIQSQRLPRKENFLCDAVCSGIVETVQLKAVLNFQQAVLKSMENSSLLGSFKKKKNKVSSSPLTDTILDHMHIGTSLLRHSIRPCLYRQVADAARAIGDALATKTIGEMLEIHEARLWPSVKDHSNNDTKERKELLIVEGAKLQMQGLNAMGREKEALQVERRHRYLVGKFGTNQEIHSDETISASQSLVNLTMSSYRDHLKSLAPGGHEPLLLSWHSVGLQTLLDNDSSDVQTGVWVERK